MDKIPSPGTFCLESTMCKNKDMIPPGIATNTTPFQILMCQTAHFGSDKFLVVAPDAKTSKARKEIFAKLPQGHRKEHCKAIEKQVDSQGGMFKAGCWSMVGGHFHDNAKSISGTSPMPHNQQLHVICTMTSSDWPCVFETVLAAKRTSAVAHCSHASLPSLKFWRSWQRKERTVMPGRTLGRCL